MKLYEQYFCNEYKKTTRSKVTRSTKIKRAASQMGTAAARNKQDPLYKQMKKFCDKCKEFREKLKKKYAHRYKSAARRR